MREFNVLSLFDGISCGQVALERAGIKVDNYYASEIDKYAIQVTQKNYPKTIQIGNAYDIDYSTLPKIDIVIGGSPCTQWAICKKGRETTSDGIGFELFMNFVTAIKELKPKYFLYENNHSIHKDIKKAISEELGVDFIMINSELVSAQSRRRCYWTNIPGIEQPEDKNILLKDIVLTDNSLKQGLSHSQKAIDYLDKKIADGRTHWDFGYHSDTSNPKSRTVIANFYKGVPFNVLVDGDNIRKFHPIETERLQMLPDNYTEGISNTQRYKSIGNGWTVGVIAHILSYLPESAKNSENGEILEFIGKNAESEENAGLGMAV